MTGDERSTTDASVAADSGLVLTAGPHQAGEPPDTSATPSPVAGARNSFALVAFTALTNLADGVTKIVLPLLATQLTSSPAQVAGVAITLTLPWLLASLHVGVLVDRFDRRRLLWLADGARTLVVVTLAWLYLADGLTMPALYVGGLVLGVAEVVALTAAVAMIPAAVPRSGRERTNAWIAGAETVCNEFAGPFVGGLLVALGSAIALGATAVAYVAGALLLVLLVGRFRPVAVTGDEPPKVRRQIVEGLSFLWRHRLLRFMALALTVLCSAWAVWLALMPLMATQVMRASPQEYGLMLSMLGVGGLVGAATVGWINRLLGQRWALFGDLLGTVVMVGIPAVTTNVVAVSVAAFLGGMGGVLWTVNSRTISQALVPDELLGRYNAAARLFSWGAMPVGAAIGGAVAQLFGLRVTFALFALVAAVLIVPFFVVIRPELLAEATSAER
ncbi:MFS transporter [Micromonospora sp. NPDC048170]|uniref:MFS transporter n=1 Tax=Micromonospora sp. NPDC048170 TaxID=3154819 RepID=UPI0033F67C90